MDLRDQLAAATLTGLLTIGTFNDGKPDARERLAREAYAIADAMLKVREEGSAGMKLKIRGKRPGQ